MWRVVRDEDRGGAHWFVDRDTKEEAIAFIARAFKEPRDEFVCTGRQAEPPPPKKAKKHRVAAVVDDDDLI